MESVDYSDEVAPRQGSDLTFHHFPIPDLSPAENMGLMSGLVNDLESLIMQKKVRPPWHRTHGFRFMLYRVCIVDPALTKITPNFFV